MPNNKDSFNCFKFKFVQFNSVLTISSSYIVCIPLIVMNPYGSEILIPSCGSLLPIWVTRKVLNYVKLDINSFWCSSTKCISSPLIVLNIFEDRTLEVII